MATKHEIIGEEWKQRAPELAEWAMQHMVNRKDVWGQYSVLTPNERIKEGRSYKAMTLPRKDMRGDDMVTIDKLTRHFASRHHHKPQIIGLHTTHYSSILAVKGVTIFGFYLKSQRQPKTFMPSPNHSHLNGKAII